jgi:hypothetical protein
MKRLLIITVALLCAHGLRAAEGINSKVIHDYTEIGVAYAFLDDVAGDNAHGVLAHTSVDMENFIFDVNGNYFRGDDDLDLWGFGGGVGYAIRLMRNHINIIPRVGVAYNRVDFGDSSEDSTTSIAPGVTLSYAINRRVSINANYTYVRGIDDEGDAHTYGAGARIAVTERIGVDIGALFAEGQGFRGAFAGASFHFW